ncbi:hypothetical protein IHO40_03655 [Wolbachia endosymbiont of Mansonella ozzardi]|nr:hypothetical protein [Wolbachia endosymbiont of Mansonella ozzardi]
MFECVGAAVPSDSILEKLVTNCNQAGYEAATYTDLHSLRLSIHSCREALGSNED